MPDNINTALGVSYVAKNGSQRPEAFRYHIN
jgi:hypothetical protein